MDKPKQDVLMELLASAIATRKRGDDAYQRWPLDLLVGLQRRIEQLEAERDAAYKRGLEDAARIADKHLRESKEASSMARPDEVATKVGCWAWGRAAEKIAAQIRHQIQED